MFQTKNFNFKEIDIESNFFKKHDELITIHQAMGNELELGLPKFAQ